MTKNAYLVWFDIPTIEIDRAIKFYSDVLKIDLKKEIYGDTSLAVFPHKEDEVAGCIFYNSNSKPSSSGTLIYFNVNDRIDEAIKIAQDLGGKIIEAKHQIGSHGFRAIILDSEGNKIALHSING